MDQHRKQAPALVAGLQEGAPGGAGRGKWGEGRLHRVKMESASSFATGLVTGSINMTKTAVNSSVDITKTAVNSSVFTYILNAAFKILD